MLNKKSANNIHMSVFCFIIPPMNEVQGIFVCLSVHLSVQIRVRPITFFWFDIGLPFLAHGCITMRQCVVFIFDPDKTFNFDLKVKFIGFLTCYCVQPISCFCFVIGLPYFAHGCITIRWYVAYMFMLDLTLNFDLKVKFIGFFTCFGIWVYHHETACCLHSWP